MEVEARYYVIDTDGRYKLHPVPTSDQEALVIFALKMKDKPTSARLVKELKEVIARHDPHH